MEEKNKKEELQSRRDFFKKAAKAALPVLGAIALSGMPGLIKAAEKSPTPASCQYGCSGGCSGHCYGGCKGSCTGSCDGNCKGCRDTCMGGCQSNCAIGCTGYTG